MTELDNPPAFPSSNEVRVGEICTSGHPGKTLLDDLAGLAMQALLSGRSYGHVKGHTAATARVSYEMANEMLKERKKWIK